MPMHDFLFLAVRKAVKHMQCSGMPRSQAWFSIYSYCTAPFSPGSHSEGLTCIFLAELPGLRVVLMVNTQAAAPSLHPPSQQDTQELSMDQIQCEWKDLQKSRAVKTLPPPPTLHLGVDTK